MNRGRTGPHVSGTLNLRLDIQTWKGRGELALTGNLDVPETLPGASHGSLPLTLAAWLKGKPFPKGVISIPDSFIQPIFTVLFLCARHWS